MEVDFHIFKHNEGHYSYHKNGEELSIKDFEDISEMLDWYVMKDVVAYDYCDKTNILQIWYEI